MNSETISIALELQRAGDSITGRASNGTAAAREFSGWLGLLAAIDALLNDHQETTTMSIETAVSTLDLLRERGRGFVVTPGEDDFDRAREAFNLTVDQRPALIAFPAGVEDVIAVVDYARARGLRVAPQRTGHNAEPLSSLADVILLKTDALDELEIDVERRSARVGAGVKWGPVSDLASEHGLSGLIGSSRDVSIVGYTLGGGLSFLGRKLGLAANSVTAIELVTADGRFLRSDRETEPELFWALRGGGGNFGVVTALEFDLFPTPEIYAGHLFFPYERASEVMRAWFARTLDAPDELTTIGRLLQVPDIPEVPDLVRGRSFAMIELYYLGNEQEGAALAAPLRALGPEIDTLGMVPPAAISHLHMDPEDPAPYHGRHVLAGDLSTEGVDALVAAAGPGSGSTLVTVEVRHLGGALKRGGTGHGSLDTLAGEYMMFALGMVMDEASGAAAHRDVERAVRALAPYRQRAYLNFEEAPTDPATFYGEQTYRRLQAAKHAYDPEGLILANHSIKGEAR